MARMLVIARNGGTEGHSGPLAVFKTEDEAFAAAAMGDQLEVFSVPIWPEPPEHWTKVQPIKRAVQQKASPLTQKPGPG